MLSYSQVQRDLGVGDSDIYVVKIDKKGNRIWEKTFVGAEDEFAYAVVAVENGFIEAGSTKSIPGSQADLIILDSQGSVLWQTSTSLRPTRTETFLNEVKQLDRTELARKRFCFDSLDYNHTG